MEPNNIRPALLISNIYGEIYEDRVCLKQKGKDVCIPSDNIRRMKVVRKKVLTINIVMFLLALAFVFVLIMQDFKNIYLVFLFIALFATTFSLSLFLNVQKYVIQVSLMDSARMHLNIVDNDNREAREFCWVFNVKVKNKKAA